MRPYIAPMPRTIAEEIKQEKPFTSRSHEASLALLRTAHLVRRRGEAVMMNEGLTMQQYNVLRILRGARGALPTMEISERMIEPNCGITRLIATLEEKQLLRREQWPGDRRQFLCQITPAGLKLLDRLDPGVNALNDAIAARLSDEQIDDLLSALATIRESFLVEET
jgi:DNA-binding MarR family transcriptional regulator